MVKRHQVFSKNEEIFSLLVFVGKSHSIFGSSAEEGILSLSIHDLITMNAKNHLKFELSFLEIYNEKVTDLLASPPSSNENTNPKSSTKSSTTSFSKQARTHILNKLVPSSTNNATRALEIREHPLLGPYVPDLKYIQVKTKEDFQNVLNLGNQQRSVASTNANQRSSRSHAIFTVKISRIDVPQSTTMRLSFGSNSSHSTLNIGKSATLSSSSKKSAKQQAQDELDTQAVRLNFVDLAGSEKSQQYNGPQGKNDRFAVSPFSSNPSQYVFPFILRKVFISINRYPLSVMSSMPYLVNRIIFPIEILV